tara:strand:- start:75 stop:422 length:348 start_codon:yes stop_codon:yes gene_type:complete
VNNAFGQFSDETLAEFHEAMTERFDFADKDKMACNKPRAERSGGKSHVVKACGKGLPEGGKLIRFGDANMTTAGKPSPNDSAKTKARRKSFKSRHAKNIAKGPSSGAYWANKVKW